VEVSFRCKTDKVVETGVDITNACSKQCSPRSA